MYIEPNTTIKLYSGIPLDNTYNHSLYFQSLADQTSYFSSTNRLKYTLNNNTYQRVERGRMRIEKTADEIYDCNYLAFQNSNYGNKWFYAFITGIEFVNNVTSEITFEIDSLQTYMFDVELKECFVERETPLTDEIGDNLQPEGIALGEYIESDYGKLEEEGLDTHNVYIMVTADSVQDDADVALYDNIRSGTLIYAFRLDDTDGITNFIKVQYQQTPDDIILMYIGPRYLYPNVQYGGSLISGSHQSGGLSFSLPTLNGDETFGSYVPHNKKLYSYPYNFINICDGGDNSLPLRYEFFEKNNDNSITPTLRIDTSLLPPLKLILRPTNYKGMTNNVVSKTESLTIEGFPYCTWNNDFYKTWLAQNAVSQIISTATNVAGGVMSIASGHVGAGVGSLVGTAASLLTSHYEASIHADVVRGNSNNGNANYSNGLLVPWYSRFHINEENAKVVDSFFDMFGYATNQIKTPSLANRPHWTYVKTNGCIAIGKAPSDEIRRICSIFDNGITFWRYASEVGDYSLDNSPT